MAHPARSRHRREEAARGGVRVTEGTRYEQGIQALQRDKECNA